MKRSIYIFSICAASLCLSGCQDLLEEDGTTSAYTKCIERAKAQSLQDHTSKTYCRNKHQKDIVITTGGTAEYVYTSEPWFYGNITNNSKTYIITSFTIVINASDKKTVERKSFEGMWIEPADKSSFTFNNSELMYKPPKSTDPDISWGWAIENVKGIKIKI